jgi:hypothetical protein
VVKIRDFSTGAEQEYPRQGLAEIVPELMASGLFTTEQ